MSPLSASARIRLYLHECLLFQVFVFSITASCNRITIVSLVYEYNKAEEKSSLVCFPRASSYLNVTEVCYSRYCIYRRSVQVMLLVLSCTRTVFQSRLEISFPHNYFLATP